jgi:hypothetical protein
MGLPARTICILPGIPTPRKGHPRVSGGGFPSPPRGYEKLQNPVRAATHYTIPLVNHRRRFWGILAVSRYN